MWGVKTEFHSRSTWLIKCSNKASNLKAWEGDYFREYCIDDSNAKWQFLSFPIGLADLT